MIHVDIFKPSRVKFRSFDITRVGLVVMRLTCGPYCAKTFITQEFRELLLVQKSGICFSDPSTGCWLLGLEILTSLLQGVILFETRRMRLVHETRLACFDWHTGTAFNACDLNVDAGQCLAVQVSLKKK
jgi:hypothetical protein